VSAIPVADVRSYLVGHALQFLFLPFPVTNFLIPMQFHVPRPC
jgi:hypothetical protein